MLSGLVIGEVCHQMCPEFPHHTLQIATCSPSGIGVGGDKDGSLEEMVICGFLGTSYYSIILGAVEHLLWTSFNFPFGFTHVHVGSIDTAFVLIHWTKDHRFL